MIAIPYGLTLKLVIGIGCALLLALLIHDRNRWKATASLRQQQVAAEKAAHLATVANYRAAAEQARAAGLANIARVKADQAAINERTADEFESRIVAARARAERLRRNSGAEADPRSGRAAPMPSLPAAARGASQATSDGRLPHSDKRAAYPEGQLGAGDALIATEQAIQLDELIKWVKAQATVPVNGAGEPRPGGD